MSLTDKYIAGVVQAAPIYLDKEKTIAKSLALIEEAAQKGVKLLAFPELWCPGYPWWVWLGGMAWQRQFMIDYFNSAIEVNGPEIQIIKEAAKQYNMIIVFGYCEREHYTLYISQAIIGSNGEVLLNRRKIKAARTERHIFGEGDGSGLKVQQTELGRIGALCCGEHYQPLIKTAMYSQQEQVHIASWPSFSMLRGKAFRTGPDAAAMASQLYAVEGQAFTLVSTMVADELMVNRVCDSPERREVMTYLGQEKSGGRSMIFSPDGEPMCSYEEESFEGVLAAEIDLNMLHYAKTSADTLGHWARPDIVGLKLDLSSHSTFVVHEEVEALDDKQGADDEK
ncbi:carbon-nitrogen hydrolase family protein [Marinomonas spartinae]|uniref:carbon-nitrogen hydrolase family protein n=1 Tax=Marinomonas spartinae TaxID=1792290 RepID=UPI0018F21DD2|nr:carbon-nitrogen hydrolase family protein [Marinomonas spartinae]MBJ7556802.1 carbon-nitrogen hydrolase family protein [Marinomonas spartinae]